MPLFDIRWWEGVAQMLLLVVASSLLIACVHHYPLTATLMCLSCVIISVVSVSGRSVTRHLYTLIQSFHSQLFLVPRLLLNLYYLFNRYTALIVYYMAVQTEWDTGILIVNLSSLDRFKVLMYYFPSTSFFL